MSNPDPRHDPENVRGYDYEYKTLRGNKVDEETWAKEYEEYQEWLSHQQTYDEEAE